MVVKQTWNKPKYKPPKNVPIEQMEAAVKLAATNTGACFAQLTMELMMITLHDEFGFGKDRCMKAFEGVKARLQDFNDNVNQEFDAETFKLSYKERQKHRADIEWTWENHERALRPLVYDDIWLPYQERYGRFGGRGSWCK